MSTRPIVFLPGASGRAVFLRPLAERVDHPGPTILVDYPGLGDAPANPLITNAASLGEAVMASLPGRFDLVAISMGSLLALRAAIAHPDRVRRLVLIAPAGGFDAPRFGASDWRPAFRTRRPDAPTWLLDDHSDLSERLDRIAAPTLLIAGDRDAISPVDCSIFLASRLAHAELKVVAGGTHDLDEEFPDLVAGMIAAHLGAQPS